MELPRRRFLPLAASIAALPASLGVALALDYPARPVRLIVGFPAGGLTDILARLLSPWLSEPVMHWDQLDSGHCHEQFPGEMDRTPNTGCRHVDLARIGLGIGDEVRNGLGRKRRIDHHDERRTGNACDWRGVTDEIEFEIIVERRIDRIRGRGHKKRVAVWGRPHDRLGSEVGAGARLIFDDELLTESL